MYGGLCRGIGASLLVLGLVLSAACGGPEVDPTALPTFPASSSEGGAAAGDAEEGLVPNDCERLLKVSDLGALLGLPLDTVTVRATVGVPEPSVGRTERIACRYTMKAGRSARGRSLLDLNGAAYTSPEAALQQWRRNADIEDGVHRDMPIGSAGAVLVERGDEALLSVVYGSATVTMVLPNQPLPGNRPRAEALVDLALRVLPSVAPPAQPSSVQQPSSPAIVTPAPSRTAVAGSH